MHSPSTRFWLEIATGTARLLFLPLLLLPASALAQAAEPPGVSGAAILQMLMALSLIVLILFAATWLLRRLNGGQAFANAGPMKVVGGLTISPRERILLIEIEESWILVGVVPGQIKTLHTLPKGELPASNPSGKAFGQWLQQIAERKHEAH